MNPDERKSTGYKVWTLIKDGTVYVFRMYYYDSGRVEVCSPDGSTAKMSVEAARGVWDSLIHHGFVVQNACHHWDMDEFYSMKRKEEKTDKMKWLDEVIEASNKKNKRKKEWLKKVYKPIYENYALEA